MFCRKCGKEIADGSAFCPSCGASVAGGAQSERVQQPVSTAGKLHCPKCKSLNLSVTTESSVNGGITTHHGGVSTTSMSNTHRNFWICADCGTKFRNIQSLEEELHASRNNPTIFTVLSVIAAIVCIYLYSEIQSSYFGSFIFGAYLIGAIAALIVFVCFAFSSKKKLEGMRTELEYLKKNCFD